MKITSLIAFCFYMMLMASCQDVRRPEKPKDLIPERKMVDVLTELLLLQGARSSSKEELERRGLSPREYLWQKFDIDSSQFARSSDYYAHDYKVYQRIYEKVKDSLEGLKGRYDSLYEQQQREMDSIREAERVQDSIRRIELQETDTLIDAQETEIDSLLMDTISGTAPVENIPERAARIDDRQ